MQCVVNQFMHAPITVHLHVVYRILHYLKGSPGAGLLYTRQPGLHVEAYTDANWAESVSDRSTSGNCTFVGGNLVT